MLLDPPPFKTIQIENPFKMGPLKRGQGTLKKSYVIGSFLSLSTYFRVMVRVRVGYKYVNVG